MKRVLIVGALVVGLAVPAGASAFHHGGLPSTACSADAAGDPSNTNGAARENLIAHNPNGIPLAPVGTPGNGQGDGAQHCANANN